MRAYAIALATVLLLGCTSERISQSTPDWPQLPSMAERQQQLENAAARAEAAHDYRPYPVGWPADALPLHRNPKIAQSIELGQSMNQVVQVMGRQGATTTASRAQFSNRIKKTYKVSLSSFKMPEKYRQVINQLPERGHFVYWEYQGFPSTANWLVVFFACPDVDSAADLRVVSRGVFRLGDF